MKTAPPGLGRSGLLVLLASCSGGEGPTALRPEAAQGTGPQAGAGDSVLAAPPELRARTAEPDVEPERAAEDAQIPLAGSSLERRIRELREAADEYRALAHDERSPALRERYHNDLLQLGRLLASYQPDGEDARPYFRQQAVRAFEDLAWDAGEDSPYGVLAFQALADLAREGGAGEDADAFDEAIDRLLDEEQDG